MDPTNHWDGYLSKFQKLELVLSWATLHFVGWVEPTPGFVGFRCTQPNLHFAGVIAKCETQQRPISEPSPKSFFFDQTGRFLARGSALMKHENLKANRRISNKKYRMMKCGIALLCHFNKIDRIHSFDIRYSLFDIRYSLFRSFLFDQTGCPLAGGRRSCETTSTLTPRKGFYIVLVLVLGFESGSKASRTSTRTRTRTKRPMSSSKTA